MTRGVLIVLTLVMATWIGSTPTDVLGCAAAPRAGESVEIADETALIIWDEANDVEHFIRQATFVGTARDFGFLVPTPNRPQLEPADSDIFQELAHITEPKTEHRTETGLSFGCAGSSDTVTDTASPNTPPGVVVLEQRQVGNLDAAVLAFRADKTHKLEDTADELLIWLTSRGYAVRPDLTEWLMAYIDRNWIITAFKISGQPGPESPPAGSNLAVKSTAVRLTFKTDRPLFPYREPAGQRDAGASGTSRALRVYVAAKERVGGTIGESLPWPASTVWANAIPDSQRTELLDRLKLPAETAAGKWWLTEFEDSSPRSGTDEIYFERSSDRGPVARTPIVVINHKTPWWAGPLAILLLFALGGAGLMLIRNYTSRGEEEVKPAGPPPILPPPGNLGPKSRDLEPRIDPRPWTS